MVVRGSFDVALAHHVALAVDMAGCELVMARKSKMTQDALAKLGADRLAAVLLAEAARNRQLKRDLELALEAGKGTSGLVASIRKRLTVIGRSRAGLSSCC